MTETSSLRYQTDFNDVDEEGLVTTLPGWGGTLLIPAVGSAVELFDGDDNTCIGVVERVTHTHESDLIFVRPIWDTWTDGSQSTLPTMEDALFEQMKRVADRVQETSNEPEPATH